MGDVRDKMAARDVMDFLAVRMLSQKKADRRSLLAYALAESAFDPALQAEFGTVDKEAFIGATSVNCLRPDEKSDVDKATEREREREREREFKIRRDEAEARTKEAKAL
jgi:hypothetical protein